LVQELRNISAGTNTDVNFPKETKLTVKVLELIAVGVSVAVNCQECLKHHGHEALKSGASEDEIVEAVKVGMMVRSGAGSIMDRFVAQQASSAGCDKFATNVSNGCACG
jgi:AhpD family alkylhydroperoxidase